MIGLRLTRVCKQIDGVAAVASAACSIPLCAARALPCATNCQESPGVPIAQAARLICTVGTTQLTVPTSVDPDKRTVREKTGGTLVGLCSCG